MKIFNHRHVSSRKQQETLFHRIGNDPHLDWSGILVIGSILSGVVMFLGYYKYTQVRDTLNEPVIMQKTDNTNVFDVESLNRVIEVFSERTTKQSSIIQGNDTLRDPSL